MSESGIWPHLRALLIALHLVAIGLMAVPAPDGGMNRSAWRDPTVQGEFEAWTTRLNALGLDWSQTEVEDTAWELASGYQHVRRALLWPFKPYYTYCGTWQSWRMFVAPHRYPARLQIEVETPDGWELLYVARNERFDWHATQLDHDRMRAAIFRFGWRPYRSHYKRFGRWVAAQVAREQPDATRVQLKFWKYRTASPEEVASGNLPDGRFEKNLLFELEEFRAPPPGAGPR